MLDDAFFSALWRLAIASGTRPETLLAVWNLESGLNPAASNPLGCIGLNQSCPAPMGGPGFPTDAESYRAEAASEQLAWIGPQVMQQVKANGGAFRSAARAVQANLLPKSLQYARGPLDAIAATGGPYADAYAANAFLYDPHKTGAITLSTLGGVVLAHAKDPALVDAIARTWAAKPDDSPWSSPQLFAFEPAAPSSSSGTAVAAVLIIAAGVCFTPRKRGRA